MKRLILAIALLCAAGCATANTRLASEDLPRPPAGSRILIVQPDVSLALLTAVGVQEARADWSQQGRDNIAAQLTTAMAAKNHAAEAFNPTDAVDGRVGQVLRLHKAVGESILFASYGPIPLPTKKKNFQWTLGEGAQELSRAAGDANYALFTFARGTYSSSGRAAMAVVGALAGVAIPTGQQQVFASLVDLRTGQVLWSNVVIASPNSDMREGAGAEALVKLLLKDAPL